MIRMPPSPLPALHISTRLPITSRSILSSPWSPTIVYHSLRDSLEMLPVLSSTLQRLSWPILQRCPTALPPSRLPIPPWRRLIHRVKCPSCPLQRAKVSTTYRSLCTHPKLETRGKGQRRRERAMSVGERRYTAYLDTRGRLPFTDNTIGAMRRSDGG